MLGHFSVNRTASQLYLSTFTIAAGRSESDWIAVLWSMATMNYVRDCGELLGGVLHASPLLVSIMVPDVCRSSIILAKSKSVFHLSPFKVSLHFQIYSQGPFVSLRWGLKWLPTFSNPDLFSCPHFGGRIPGSSSPFPFLFHWNVLLHHIPPPSLSIIPNLSFICSPLGVSAPLCTCNMTSGQHRQWRLLCFPVYRRPCDLHLPLLCQSMSHSHRQLICTERYYCGEWTNWTRLSVGKKPAVFCLFLTEGVIEWMGARWNPWQEWGKLWSDD